MRSLLRPTLLSFFILPIAFATLSADEFKPTAQSDIVSADAKLEMLWNDGEFTEGPVATGYGGILFSDIGNKIFHFNPKTKKTTVFRADSGKSNGLIFNADGQLIACEGANGGNRRISITEKGGKVRTLADSYKGKRFNSPNDLAVTAAGDVYFTDPRYVGDEPRELDAELVFRVTPEGKVSVATREVQKPNGILISADGKTAFVADNNPAGNRHLLRFDVAADGTFKNKKVLFKFSGDERGIDGMTLDAKGNVYATAGKEEKSGVYVFSPEGKHLALIKIPGAPTNCVFGHGGKESSTLYVTAPGPKEKGRYALYRIKLKQSGAPLFPKK